MAATAAISVCLTTIIRTAPGSVYSLATAGSMGILHSKALQFRWIADAIYRHREWLNPDTPPANIVTGSRARILSFDIDSGAPGAEYIYDVEPVVFIPASIIGFATNGLGLIVAVGDRQFITIERAADALIPVPTRPVIPSVSIMRMRATPRMYQECTIAGARCSGKKDIAAGLVGTEKRDGSALAQGNIEGITLGLVFNGRRTVILVADNNFTRTQLTQFIALEMRHDMSKSPPALRTG